MTEQFDAILQKYGKTVELQGAPVRAFVQRMREKGLHAPEEPGDFGAADLRRWLYIGPKERPLQAGDRLRFDGGAYCVQNAAAVYLGGEKAYWWAVLCPERERMP